MTTSAGTSCAGDVTGSSMSDAASSSVLMTVATSFKRWLLKIAAAEIRTTTGIRRQDVPPIP